MYMRICKIFSFPRSGNVRKRGVVARNSPLGGKWGSEVSYNGDGVS